MTAVAPRAEGTGASLTTSKRTEVLEDRPVNLDGFVEEWPEKGLVAMERTSTRSRPCASRTAGSWSSTAAPATSSTSWTRSSPTTRSTSPPAEDAMATESVEIARMLVDPRTSRADVVAVGRGLTPAKILDVVKLMNVVEIMMGIQKTRSRRTPANQAHSTSAKDNPIQVARRRRRGRRPRVRRAGDHPRRRALRPARGDRPAGRRPGRARRRAHPVRARGGHRARPRHARHHRLRRDDLDLRHRVGVRRRRRHPLVEGVPGLGVRRRAASRCASPRAPGRRCRWATPRAGPCCTWRSAASSWPRAPGCRACRTARSRASACPARCPAASAPSRRRT